MLTWQTDGHNPGGDVDGLVQAQQGEVVVQLAGEPALVTVQYSTVQYSTGHLLYPGWVTVPATLLS